MMHSLCYCNVVVRLMLCKDFTLFPSLTEGAAISSNSRHKWYACHRWSLTHWKDQSNVTPECHEQNLIQHIGLDVNLIISELLSPVEFLFD